ncbi:nitroreductase family protein [Enemella evansiae]|uniref:nitroreductase family protein n=1 Tax=Enemella evansiae TaxID=2016499 RepID=UPI001E5D11F1|nr:nitroreductase family protein [Enemella evansiae]
MSDAEVDVLLEAARRAPSAGNSQPWSFIIGRRGDAIHDSSGPSTGTDSLASSTCRLTGR